MSHYFDIISRHWCRLFSRSFRWNIFISADVAHSLASIDAVLMISAWFSAIFIIAVRCDYRWLFRCSFSRRDYFLIDIIEAAFIDVSCSFTCGAFLVLFSAASFTPDWFRFSLSIIADGITIFHFPLHFFFSFSFYRAFSMILFFLHWFLPRFLPADFDPLSIDFDYWFQSVTPSADFLLFASLLLLRGHFSLFDSYGVGPNIFIDVSMWLRWGNIFAFDKDCLRWCEFHFLLFRFNIYFSRWLIDISVAATFSFLIKISIFSPPYLDLPPPSSISLLGNDWFSIASQSVLHYYYWCNIKDTMQLMLLDELSSHYFIDFFFHWWGALLSMMTRQILRFLSIASFRRLMLSAISFLLSLLFGKIRLSGPLLSWNIFDVIIIIFVMTLLL